MGQCPCFGRKKVMQLQREKERDPKPPQISNVSELYAVKPRIKIETRPEASVTKDGSDGKNNAQTFFFRDLATATNNFRPEALIGEGGFGAVYKGQLETGQAVAVKKLNHLGSQGDKEFLVEVLMLSLLRHPNLVNLIGYCAEGDQRLLVYEFMPLGSLEYHLHDLTANMEPLDWNTRMKIAVGAANGLNYLHNEANPPVIYRDLKSSNILLGEGYDPKLSDFGLAKFGPTEDKSHVSTRVMGTRGYCAPDYFISGKLTLKSDIYSFGVVLLELITGLKALDTTRRHTLVEWARPMLKDRRNVVQLADPRLNGQFLESVLQRALDVASMCLREEPQSRPSMAEVVVALNYLISQQHDPNTQGSGAGRERSSRTTEKKKGPRNENMTDSKGGLEGFPKETTPLDNDLERERAVAEAKMWGKTCREKRRQK